MATFTPPIQPENSPGYGRDSRAVDIAQGIRPEGVATNQIMPQGVKQGDLSAAYAGEAAAAGVKAEAVGDAAYADLFKNTVATADFLGKAGVQMVKKDIEDKVYEVADRERQAYTDVLEKIKAGTGVRNILDANAEDTGEESTPQEVAQLPDTLSALQGARDSGKISGTYYQSRLLAEAKSLRAQYPGFREEIDQAFAKITGSNPANAYVASLVQDINRAAASASSDKNRVLSFIQSHLGYPDAQTKYQQYNAGTISKEDVMNWAAPYAQQDFNLKNRALIYNDQKNTRDDKQRIAGDTIDYAAGVVVNRAVDSITAQMGLNNSTDLARLTSMQAGGQIDPKTWQMYGQRIADIKTSLFNTAIRDADAHGYTKDAGGKAVVIEKINQALKPIDALLDRVYNKDFGGIYDVKNQLQAQNDMTKQGLLNDPKLGPYFQVNQAVKDIGGEQNLQRFNLENIKGNFPDDFKQYFGRMSKEMASQYNMRTTGTPYTFNSVIDNLKTNNVTNGAFNKAVLSEVKKIADPTIPEPIRYNYAQAAFSPENRGMISRLEADGYDAKGRPVSGQSGVYQMFTSPEMTRAMYEMGKKDPHIWENYVTWSKETFANELVPRELQDLSTNFDASGMGLGSSVGWDSKNHRFIYQYNQMPGTVNSPTIGDKHFEASVNRVNSELYNLKQIALVTHEDIDAFVLKTIADNAGPEALRNINGLPYKIMRDIGLSRMQYMNNGR